MFLAYYLERIAHSCRNNAAVSNRYPGLFDSAPAGLFENKGHYPAEYYAYNELDKAHLNRISLFNMAVCTDDVTREGDGTGHNPEVSVNYGEAFIYAKKVSYLEPVLENDKFVYDEEAAEVRLQGAEVTAFPLTGDCRTIGTAGAETWYFAEGDIDINDRLAVEGNVNLILCDGCNLTVVDGITVNEGDSLTFYGQKMRTGVLTAKGIKNNKAVIGGEGGYTNGNITVNGGNINAVVKFKGTHSWGFADEGSFAGIGGGWGGSGKNITINAGTVYAKGGNGAAGIGGSGYNNCTDITINGGKVHAVGGSGGAGIGGGYYGDASNIIINGGYVRAIGEGAGIGGGTDDYDTEDMDDGEYEEWSYERLGMPLRSLMGKVRNLQINGGTVEATGDYCAMGSPYSTGDEFIEDTITVADDCAIYAGSDEETAVPVEKSNYLNGTMNYKYIKIDF